MTAKEILAKAQEYEEEGWTYAPDPSTWSGGMWIHEELGFVNYHGGSYPSISEAVEGLGRFLDAFAKIQSRNGPAEGYQPGQGTAGGVTDSKGIIP